MQGQFVTQQLDQEAQHYLQLMARVISFLVFLFSIFF